MRRRQLVHLNRLAEVLAGMPIEHVIAKIFYLRANQMFADEKIKGNDGVVVEQLPFSPGS